jgi:hypothetical protein
VSVRRTWPAHFAVPIAVALASVGCASTSDRVAVTPRQGQTGDQIDRDRFECGLRAQKQTGWDPGASQRNGAIIGLLAGGAAGAALGAGVGAAAGATADGATLGAAGGGSWGGAAGMLVKTHRDGDVNDRAFSTCLRERGYDVQPERTSP